MNYFEYLAKSTIKLTWPGGMIAGLYYVGYFDFMRSFLERKQDLTSIPMLVSYPLMFIWVSGTCSRMIWDSLISDDVYKFKEDGNYAGWTGKLMNFNTGSSVFQNILVLAGIITAVIAKK